MSLKIFHKMSFIIYWIEGNNHRRTKSLGKTRNKTVNLLGRPLDDGKKCDLEKPRRPSHCDGVRGFYIALQIIQPLLGGHMRLISLGSSKLLIELNQR